VVQRVNSAVFSDPEAVMRNVVAAAGRVGSPRFLPTRDGAPWFTAPGGGVWRAYEFIEGRTFRRATAPELAEAAARAFGSFVRRLSDPPLALSETLPGFHDTRGRLRQLEFAASRDTARRAREVRAELDRILEQSECADAINARIESGAIPRRAAHNDARIANVVFDPESASVRCVIDLDTVMPSTPLHDFGDLVRSMATAFPDEAPDPRVMRVREPYFGAIVRGFLGGTDGMLTDSERALLVTAARSIALEQAARFLADHLEGDRYYAVERPGQNLARARTQLALFGDLTRRSGTLEAIVEAGGRLDS
jgi:aminoglycoside phosphotransferase (APT) family kinase protein